jgi:hypothetical protein
VPGDSVQVLLRLGVGACTNRELRRSANCIRRQLASLNVLSVPGGFPIAG